MFDVAASSTFNQALVVMFTVIQPQSPLSEVKISLLVVVAAKDSQQFKTISEHLWNKSCRAYWLSKFLDQCPKLNFTRFSSNTVSRSYGTMKISQKSTEIYNIRRLYRVDTVIRRTGHMILAKHSHSDRRCDNVKLWTCMLCWNWRAMRELHKEKQQLCETGNG